MDFEESESTDYELPQGHDLNDLILLEDYLGMVTNGGVWFAAKDGGTLDDISLWDYYPGTYTAGAQLVTDGGDDYVVALGFGGFGSVFQINSISITELQLGTGISNTMFTGNATATVIEHVDVSSGPLTLYVLSLIHI